MFGSQVNKLKPSIASKDIKYAVRTQENWEIIPGIVFFLGQ